MDKILISSLNRYVQNAILNDQKRFNPNLDAYIDETEIGDLLSYFGAKDIKELQDDGLDTFKSEPESQKTDGASEEVITEETAAAEEVSEKVVSEETFEPEEVSEETTSEETVETEEMAMIDKAFSLMHRDRASRELVTYDSKDIALNSPDNPLSTIYEASSSNNSLQSFIEDVAGEIQKIEDEVTEGEMTEESKYEYEDKKGNKRTITVKQSISMGGIVNKEKEDVKTENGNEDDAIEPVIENNLDGGLRYVLTAQTENSKFGFKANIENTDQDFMTYFMNNQTLKNGGKLDLTGSGRMTLDQKAFLGSGGLAIDYNSKDDKVSAGALGHFNYNSDEMMNVFGCDAEAYVNYKNIGGMHAGVSHAADLATISYGGVNLYGSKEFDSGLSLYGALSTQTGYTEVDFGENGGKFGLLINSISARGSLAFKAGNDISANADAMVVYENAQNLTTKSSLSSNVGAIFRGDFTKGKIKAYVVGCLYKDFNSEIKLLTGTATAGVEKMDFPIKGIAAFVEGTVCNTNANQNPESSINGIKAGTRINF